MLAKFLKHGMNLKIKTNAARVWCVTNLFFKFFRSTDNLLLTKLIKLYIKFKGFSKKIGFCLQACLSTCLR